MKKFLQTQKRAFATFMMTAVACLTATTAMADTAKNDTIFKETFDTKEDFEKWTIINTNGGRTWEFHSLRGTRAAYMLDMSGLPGDDWIVSPAIRLEAGKKYELTCWVGANRTKTESEKIYLGTGNTSPSDFTTLIADFPSIVYADNANHTFSITVEKTGDYYLGFYAYSAAKQSRLELDDVSVVDVTGGSTSISAINGGKIAEGDAVYTLGGTLVGDIEQMNGSLNGIYIVKQNGTARKVIF